MLQSSYRKCFNILQIFITDLMNPNFFISSQKNITNTHLQRTFWNSHYTFIISFLWQRTLSLLIKLWDASPHNPQTHTRCDNKHISSESFIFLWHIQPFHILHPHWTHKALLLLDILANISCHCSLYIILQAERFADTVYRHSVYMRAVFRRADGRPIKMNRYLHSVNSHLLYALSSSQWQAHALHKTTRNIRILSGMGNSKT